MERTIVAGAIGNCVHVAGTVNFLRIAEELGYKSVFLGAAVPVEDFVKAIRKHDPAIVGVSYRLTPDVAEGLLRDMKSKMEQGDNTDRRFVFGGTPPVCKAAGTLGWFERCFDGLENPRDVREYLGSAITRSSEGSVGDTLIERLENSSPYPLLRHHFGLPNLADTVDGVRRIAKSGVLDVISLAPDQNAQESYFRQEEMDPALDGAGGVPVRTPEDLSCIYGAGRTGNRPLFRIYSGTRDLVKWAELSARTVNNAWGAVPLCWYSALDGRSARTPKEAIRENQQAMRWYAEHGIPLEVNESHHWSMRDAHDTIGVATAYLAAYNAKRMGVCHYVSQYMLNTPPAITGCMDLAKMLAKIELIETLQDKSFRPVRQVRAGLLHLSPRLNIAKGQLAASTALAMQLRPDIMHVVGFCEGDHAATASDIIESCEIVHGVLRNALAGMPDMTADADVQARKNELIKEAGILISAISDIRCATDDPLSSPEVLSATIEMGMLDAPHLKGNPYAAGMLNTTVQNGAVYPVDKGNGRILSERERLSLIKERALVCVE
ncbi:MAG: cobalamin B12-binding domain-containing protein [Armatimonadota bacterium]|jgi:hypothetical protein